MYLMKMEALFFDFDHHIGFKSSGAKPDQIIQNTDERFCFKPLKKKKKRTDHV